MSISPEDFVNRLEALSKSGGIPYGRSQIISGSEQTHQKTALQFKGYVAMAEAFKCFFLETVELVNTTCRPRVREPLSEFYPLLVSYLASNFRSLCGAERLANLGYPYQAYTLLRNIFDSVVMTSAALQKLTDFYSIEGIVPGQGLDKAAVKKLRKDTEFNVRRRMTGNQSGLTQETQAELAKWDALFDFEVHGARLSLAGTVEWLKGEQPLLTTPKFDELQFAMFVNRYCEIAWMVHRLIPAVQPSSAPLPPDWADRWKTIDQSFEIIVNSITQQFEKKIGAAMVEFVKTKFPFDEKSVFPL